MGEKKRRLAAGLRVPPTGGGTAITRLLARAKQFQHAGRLGEAKTAFEQLIRTDPRQPDAWYGLGLIAVQTGAWPAAADILAKAVALSPESFEFRTLYANVLQHTGREEAASEQWQAVCRLRPDDADSWESLGILQQGIGNTEAAARAYRQALALKPSMALRTKLATLISPITTSVDAILAERGHMESEVDALLAHPIPADQTVDDPLTAALWTNFYLAYHGMDDLPLQQKTAELYRRIIPSLDYVATQCRQPRSVNGRIRVGMVSRFFQNHSIGRTSRGLFAHLSRDRFEVVAIFIEPIIDDEYSRFIRQHVARSIVVPQNLSIARGRISELDLDILFYQDVGMEPFSYFLAYSRLAPVQCVSFGHPDTTGIPAIDYFVSNDLCETEASAKHYSERLFLLHNLGSLAYYYRPELPVRRKTRADFGLSDGEHLYLCPQNLFKFHPDMDTLIADVLRRDPSGRLVMVEGKIGQWTRLLKQRWTESIPDVSSRIVFVPRMNSQDYLNLIAVADVMLDTIHFNGMNTSLEALSVGTPVVTLPGAFQRGRHTQAMYRKMGITECIAGNAESYVELAIRLANDDAFRSDVKNRILARNGSLFEDMDVIREFERFFTEVVESRN